MSGSDERISKMLEVLTEYSDKNFTRKIPVSDQGDELDAIATGLNVMAEEVRGYIKEINDKENQLETFFKYAPDAIVVIDRLGKITNWNPKAEKIFGWTREEAVGSYLHETIIPEKEAHIKAIDHFLKTGKGPVLNKSVELPALRKDGSELYAELSISPFQYKDEYFFIGFVKDITERKEAEEQLQAVNQELEAFTYSVSHDLRAPLSSVNGFSKMLIEDHGTQLDDKAKRIIDVICRNASNMGVLIDELLAFSRLGRKEVQKAVVNMNHMVEEVTTDLNRSMPFEGEINTGTLHHVCADSGLLHQVMFNLISNAVKYSSKKKNPVVEIASREESGNIIFSVKDNGAGFDMKYADKLFGVFQRLHSEEEFEGTGVGLATVKRIIARHGGKVWAEGKLNEGATFCFSLPKNK